jgi:hypothetical protein
MHILSSGYSHLAHALFIIQHANIFYMPLADFDIGAECTIHDRFAGN